MVRFALEKDADKILDLLRQVNQVHHSARPDIFKLGVKYDIVAVKELINNRQTPLLVWVDESDKVWGYCFCILQNTAESAILKGIKTLYIDDLCVDETRRGQGIGTQLYNSALALAKEKGCYNLTLNVWSCNPSALAFYRSLGLADQKIYMEKVLV